MGSYGRQVLAETGSTIQVTADGFPEWHPIGITIDWSTVAAVSGSDATYEDGTVVKVGQKGIPFGTVLCKITTAEVQTLTIDATGGTYTITGNGLTTDPIAENASAATVQAAIRGLGGDYAEVVVTGSAGGPYTITFPAHVGNVAALTTDATSLTGGAGTAVVATTTSGVAGGGYWGPYDSGATDGRQTLSRSNCGVLNMTVVESAGEYIGTASDHPPVLEGGLVWRARLRIGGTDQPSVADFEAAFPRIQYVNA